MGGSESHNLPKYSIEIPGSKSPGNSGVFVNPNSKAYLYSKYFSGSTLYESFKYSCSQNSNRPFLGTRIKTEDGFGPYEWLSYSQVEEKVKRIGWALASLRLNEKDCHGHSFLGIYGKNTAEWVMMDFACMHQDITSIPIYDTLQSDALEYIVSQTQMKAIACNEKSTQNVLKLKSLGQLSTISTIIQFEPINSNILEEAERLGLKLINFNDLISLCESGTDNPPSPDSIFTICYTSGTTGRAKGAMIKHSNMISAMSGLFDMKFVFTPQDVHLSYLPLAHVMERLGIHHFLSFGVAIGFYQGEILKLKEDLAELKPTLLVSVPRLFNRFYELISQQLGELTGVKKLLADRAIAGKMHYFRTQGTLVHKLWDSLIFKKIKNVLGGRVQLMVTGSAPISPDVLNFLKVVFSCQIIEGYGQTESCGASILTSIDERRAGIIGGPTTTLEVKLADVPDMNYFSTDVDENGNPTPRGEICMRGPTIFSGYYESPELTAEAIDHEGWLHSGDVGIRNYSDGSFKIIDRKKNFFKLQQGEYVSSEKVEMVYNQSYFISQIFVYGDSLQCYLIAIIVPDEAYVRKHWAKANGFDDSTPFSDICASANLTKDILADMDLKAKEAKLLGFEVVKKIHLEPKPWTPEDLLTPTQKLMRFNAKKKYESILTALYSSN